MLYPPVTVEAKPLNSHPDSGQRGCGSPTNSFKNIVFVVYASPSNISLTKKFGCSDAFLVNIKDKQWLQVASYNNHQEAAILAKKIDGWYASKTLTQQAVSTTSRRNNYQNESLQEQVNRCVAAIINYDLYKVQLETKILQFEVSLLQSSSEGSYARQLGDMINDMQWEQGQINLEKKLGEVRQVCSSDYKMRTVAFQMWQQGVRENSIITTSFIHH